MLHNAFRSYRIKLHNIFHHLGGAFSPYLAGLYAKPLQTVGLLRSVAKDMYLAVTLLVPSRKLNTGDSLNAIAFTKDFCAVYRRHCVMIGYRNEINARFLCLNDNILNSERTVGKSGMAMEVAYHKLISLLNWKQCGKRSAKRKKPEYTYV